MRSGTVPDTKSRTRGTIHPFRNDPLWEAVSPGALSRVYILNIIEGQLSSRGTRLPPNYNYKNIFPMTALYASPALIRPATETFQIWKFIYTYSGIFIAYTLTTVFRKEALKILSPLFYVFWIAAVGFAIAYTLIRLRGKYFEAFL